ncbi:uncharacterized protein DDB_G0292186 isoform X2 [Eurytemora carolleeae]|uniref:uncharacterized protein DDB_G0292186 isoform X2 n=1 Tax=Eurytemora carolleeae TaxID=1294199 RepID=UPI000C781267|nr:uncharacterized protein DDB_G0292186 isoform X2 [Eurytemora carolleeae]|eukprot:XP_023343901.1 uncharacterized protein DDB_G0292186-like isoform X2 [Eurytemora affinis]
MKVLILVSTVLVSCSGQDVSSLINAQGVPQVPGLDVWQAALIAHAAAEQRLSGFLTQPQPQQQQQQQPVFRPQPQPQPQPERNTDDLRDASAPVIQQLLDSQAPGTSTESEVAAETTVSVSEPSQNFQNILKSSLVKFIEQIQESRQAVENPEIDELEDSESENKNEDAELDQDPILDLELGGSESFLDKLLNKFNINQELKDPAPTDPSLSDILGITKQLKNKNSNKPSANIDTEKETISDFFQDLLREEDLEKYNEIADVAPERTQDLEKNRAKNLEKNGSFKLGNFLQDELTAAVKESSIIAAELENLLEELEVEKKKDLKFLEETFEIINSKLRNGVSIRDLNQDKDFINSVFHRFALLGHPLREEDISLQTLLEAKRLVTENVISAAEKTRSMAVEIQNQLDGKIRRKGRQFSYKDLLDVESNLKSVLNLIRTSRT